MPTTSSKHTDEAPIQIMNFTGGMNTALPPAMIKENEGTVLENMFIERAGGRLRTRWPYIRYSSSTVGSINAIYYYSSVWFVSSSGYLYYLDSGLDPVNIGALNGASTPTFAAYNDKLVVASGGTVQYTTVSAGVAAALQDVSGGPTASIISQRYSRLVSSGDSTYPDRIQEGTYADETTWGANDYGDVGYKDGTSIVAVSEAFEGMYVVFKRGGNGLLVYYASSLSHTDPACVLVGEGYAAKNQHCVVNILGRLYFLDDNNFLAIDGTDSTGKVVFNLAPGIKLGKYLSASSSAQIFVYPRDGQIWVIPDYTNGRVYVYHHNYDAWSRFTSETHIRCGFYDASGGYLYLGADDGYIYKYDHSSAAYADTVGAYPQRLITGLFAFPSREVVVKDPGVYWTALAEGTLSLRLRDKFGTSVVLNESASISGPSPYVYDTRTAGDDVTYVYDTRAGGLDEQYVFRESVDDHYIFEYNLDMENVQFEIFCSSGGLILDNIVAGVARGRGLM